MQDTLARKLRVLRAERGLTIREAERLTGVDKDTLSKLERGVRRPYDITLSRLARGYDVPVEELLEEPAELSRERVPLAEESEGTGPEALDELLDRLGARTKNLANPELIRDLEGASDAAVGAVISEIRQEMELLIPELQRRSREVMRGDPDFMPTNLVLEEASRQVLMWSMFLRARAGVEPEEVEIDAFRDLSRELVGLAMTG